MADKDVPHLIERKELAGNKGVFDLSCPCGWSAKEINAKFLQSVEDRHLRLNTKE